MFLKSLTMLLCALSVIALGCAGMEFFSGDPTTQQVLAKIAIQQATVRAIQAEGEAEAPARAAAVVHFVDEALLVVQNGDDAVITTAELYQALQLVLPNDLSPADQLLVTQLVELVVVEVNARIPDDQVDLPVAEISVVLNWVREAAALLAPVE